MSVDNIACFFVATKRPVQIIQPCNPSPCGVNAECTERNRAASCKCIRDYIGNPYVKCKPECVTNSECPRDKACVNQHCVDPCPGVCGAHATCRVTSHAPQCTCDPGYTGNAFIACQRITTSKFYHYTEKSGAYIELNLFQHHRELLKDRTLATPHPVVQMLIARREMELHPVDVFKTTLETPMLHAVQSAQSTRTAPLTRHAQDYTVWTPVLGCVEQMPSAGLSTTSQPAPALIAMKEIRSPLAAFDLYVRFI